MSNTIFFGNLTKSILKMIEKVSCFYSIVSNVMEGRSESV